MNARFIPFFRNKFQGLFRNSDWFFFPGLKIQRFSFPQFQTQFSLQSTNIPQIQKLLESSRFPGLSRTYSLFPGLSSAGKCQNKIPQLSRFSRTCKNLVNSLITRRSCSNYSAIIGGALLLVIVRFK